MLVSARFATVSFHSEFCRWSTGIKKGPSASREVCSYDNEAINQRKNRRNRKKSRSSHWIGRKAGSPTPIKCESTLTICRTCTHLATIQHISSLLCLQSHLNELRQYRLLSPIVSLCILPVVPVYLLLFFYCSAFRDCLLYVCAFGCMSVCMRFECTEITLSLSSLCTFRRRHSRPPSPFPLLRDRPECALVHAASGSLTLVSLSPTILRP